MSHKTFFDLMLNFFGFENRYNFGLALGPILVDSDTPKGTPLADEDSTNEGLQVDLFSACYLGRIWVASKTALKVPQSSPEVFNSGSGSSKSA